MTKRTLNGIFLNRTSHDSITSQNSVLLHDPCRSVLCGYKSAGFVEVRVDESDARFLHKSNQRFLGDVSNLAPLSSSIPSANVRLQRVLLLRGMPFCHFVTGTSQNYRLNLQRLSRISCNYNMHRKETLHVQMAIPVRMLTD
jgi:hypothetical protein